MLCTLLIRPGEIFESGAQSLFTMNEHAIANVYLDFRFLLRIIFVKISIVLQISFALKHYKRVVQAGSLARFTNLKNRGSRIIKFRFPESRK